jgi:hypothetical protein
MRLTDYRAEDKGILRLLFPQFPQGAVRRAVLRQAGRTVVARRQILFHATTFRYPLFDGLHPKKGRNHDH